MTLPVSVLSNYWEWTTVNVDILKQINLQNGFNASPVAGGKLFLITKEDEAVSEREWLNNPSILANTNSGLWSSCLSISGDYDFMIIYDHKYKSEVVPVGSLMSNICLIYV